MGRTRDIIDFELGGFSLMGYKASLYSDTDFEALAHSFRMAGGELAVAATRVCASWDGHHRLCQAIARWHNVVANERKHRKG